MIKQIVIKSLIINIDNDDLNKIDSLKCLKIVNQILMKYYIEQINYS